MDKLAAAHCWEFAHDDHGLSVVNSHVLPEFSGPALSRLQYKITRWNTYKFEKSLQNRKPPPQSFDLFSRQNEKPQKKIKIPRTKTVESCSIPNNVTLFPAKGYYRANPELAKSFLYSDLSDETFPDRLV
jgi:hypothetical protein